MDTGLYLDTARLGRMCPGARRAERHFSKLVSQSDSILYLTQFLQQGIASLPAKFAQEFPGLTSWRGVLQLKQDFLRMVHGGDRYRVLFFGQSAPMTELVMKRLLVRSDRVLITDLLWPPYAAKLKRLAELQGKRVVVARIAGAVFQGATRSEIVKRVADCYCQHNCDGLLISDITSCGVRMPLRPIIQQVRKIHGDATVVVDGAQALNHHPVYLEHLEVDAYLAGTPKWLRTFHPLRVLFVREGFLPERYLANELPDDSLLRFTQELAGEAHSETMETVNVVPLVCAAGALNYWSHQARPLLTRWQHVLGNWQRLARMLSCCGMVPRLAEGLRSGILSVSTPNITAPWGKLLAHEQIACSQSPQGFLRFSLNCSHTSLNRLSSALRQFSGLNTKIFESVTIPHRHAKNLTTPRAG